MFLNFPPYFCRITISHFPIEPITRSKQLWFRDFPTDFVHLKTISKFEFAAKNYQFRKFVKTQRHLLLTYKAFPTILSLQHAWNTWLQRFSVIPKVSVACSKMDSFGFSQVPGIFPNVVWIPFLQQNLFPRLRWCFFSFLLSRFFKCLLRFKLWFPTQDFNLRP